MTRKGKPHGNEDPRYGKSGTKSMASRIRERRGGDPDALADWGYCDGATLVRLVSGVANQGGAVLLGYSRDRGAYRVIVMDEDDKTTLWCPCTSDITEFVEGLVSDLLPPLAEYSD